MVLNLLHNGFTLRNFLVDPKRPEKITQNYYLAKISRLAMAQFKYTSTELDNLFLIEYYLWIEGRVMVWKSDTLGWVVTRCIETGFNVNGFAIKWRPVLDNQVSNEIVDTPEMGIDDKCVVIYDTPSRLVPSSICTIWIEEIADINETIKSQTFLQKTPIMAVCDNPKDKEYLRRNIIDIKNNIKVLFVGKDIRNDYKTFKMDAPFNIEYLHKLLKQKESEMLEFLGIDSQTVFGKKERLITSEQESNNQILSYLINDRYESRLIGCEKLRQKGLNITVEKTAVEITNYIGTKENGQIIED